MAFDILKKINDFFTGTNDTAHPAAVQHAATEAPAHPLASVSSTGGAAAPAHTALFSGMVDTAKPAPTAAPTGGAPAPAAAPVAAAPHHLPTDPTALKVYQDNQQRIAHMNLDPSKAQQQDMKSFEANYAKHKADYETVAAKEDMPPELIAALHWRESSGNFHTYLAQGDPLGKPAVHIPRNEPVRSDWTLAAEDALSDHKGNQTKVDLHQDTTDLAAMATYAEYYNGLGYHNKGKPSPYVWAGTDQYTSGKYVADGKYDPNAKDSQLGVMSMVEDLEKLKAQQQVPPK